ncbi:hypothetical protein K1719_002814 [Acacia pycnantha]|nr:hypothetical protein K1719_002814 [Acacia pycnantha]
MVRGSSRSQSPIPAPHDRNYGTTWLAAATAACAAVVSAVEPAETAPLRRRWLRSRQHAEILHRRPWLEDFAHRRARREPLLYRFCHRSPRLRQALPSICRSALIESRQRGVRSLGFGVPIRARSLIFSS